MKTFICLNSCRHTQMYTTPCVVGTMALLAYTNTIVFVCIRVWTHSFKYAYIDHKTTTLDSESVCVCAYLNMVVQHIPLKFPRTVAYVISFTWVLQVCARVCLFRHVWFCHIGYMTVMMTMMTMRHSAVCVINSRAAPNACETACLSADSLQHKYVSIYVSCLRLGFIVVFMKISHKPNGIQDPE